VLIYVRAVVAPAVALMLPGADGRSSTSTPAALFQRSRRGLVLAVLQAPRRGLASHGVELDLDGAVVRSAQTTGATIFQQWVLFRVLSVLLLAALWGRSCSRAGPPAGAVSDAALVAVAAVEPALRDRRVRRPGAP
jgi:hypothetical protein